MGKNAGMARWEWERMKPPHFPFLIHNKQKACMPKYIIERKTGIRETWPSLDISNLIFSCFWYRCKSTGYLFHDVHENQQKVRWNASTWDFMAVRGNEIMRITNGTGKGMEMKPGWTWEREWEWEWTVGNWRGWNEALQWNRRRHFRRGRK